MATTVITETQIVAVDEQQVQSLVEGGTGEVTLVEDPAQIVLIESPDPVGPDDITEYVTLVVQESDPITLYEDVDEITILNTEQIVTLTTTETKVLIEDAAIGPQGIPGPPGPTSVYVQPSQPTVVGDRYIWIQTELGSSGEDWTVWFEDGTP